MKGILLRKAYLFANKFILSPPNWNPNRSPLHFPLAILSRFRLSFYSSESGSSSGSKLTQTQNPSSSIDIDDVSTKELKMRIDKYLTEGDMEAIPSFFEAILKRKLSGKHEQSDDELMEEFQQKPNDDNDDVDDDHEFDEEIDGSSDEEELDGN